MSGKERIKMKNRQRLGKTTVAIVVSTLAFSNCAWGLPQGGTVVTGNGSYTSSGNQMDITGTGNVSVKWDSFNVAAGETVNFKNMNAILNYVTGRQGSEIFGALNGQGVHVFLINPNGILFGKTAQVNVGSLTASTKSLSDVDAALQNFKNSAGISDFGIAGTAELVNMGELEADTLRFEGSRIVLDTDNIKLGGDDFDGSNAVINGDFANGNVVLGYTAHDANGYAGKDKNFDINGGAQSVKGYMWVTNAEQLQDINTNLSGNYALKNDIDASSINSFIPISADSTFKGTFDGLENEIKNVTVNGGNGSYKGLFGQTASGSVIRNLTLSNCNISGYQAVGAVVGQNNGLIENVAVSGIVSGTSKYTGGIVGINAGIIKNAEVDITVNNTSGGYSGGITGYNYKGLGEIDGIVGKIKVINSTGGYTGGIVGYNAGSVKNVDAEIDLTGGGVGIGGIAGQNTSTGTIDGILLKGKIDAGNNSAVGGIAGANTGIINSVHNYASVSGNSTVGGIVGQNNGNISDGINDGSIKGNELVGGICGQNKVNGYVYNIENRGFVGGAREVGGAIGENNGTVSKALNKGSVFVTDGVSVSSSYYIGGVLGYNDAEGSNYVSELKNEGTVKGYSYVGGVIGCNASGKIIVDAINNGNISGLDSVGGILGYYYCDDDMLLENTNNSGTITGRTAVGGIVGMGGGVSMSGPPSAGIGCVSVSRAENSGAVSGSGNSIGGIIGVGTSSKSIDNVLNTGTVQGRDQVGGIIGNSVEGIVENALNLGQVIAADGNAQYCGGIVGWGPGAIVSDKAVYATTDKDGNTYDISKYNDKGVGKAYADIFPAPPLPPDPPELPEDEHDITKLPEFEDNYHSSSSAVTSELHTPVIINPSGENTNIGVGTIEIHNSDDSLNASGSGSSFSTGFENILAGAGQEEQADSNSRSSDTGDVQGSQMDNLAGGNDTDLSMSSDSDTEDQDE